jgi:hypothetical protein
MPVTNFHEYAKRINILIDSLLFSTQATLTNLQIDQRSMVRGFVVGVLTFNDDSELHFREFIDLTNIEPRLMYAYHYQDVDKKLIFRYDNAPHKPALAQPEHKHTSEGVILSSAPSLVDVIDEIMNLSYT